MKIFYLIFLLSATFIFARAQEPKVVSDCTVTFNITSNQASTNNNLTGAVKTLYLNSKMVRVDIVSAEFSQSVIYNSNTGEAVILKELGGNKYLTKINAEKYRQQNNRYDGIKPTFSNEVKTILGYECKKGSAVLKDGSEFTFYYATAFTLSASENPYQFKGIPGCVLEYDIIGADKKTKITYTASRINFNPVPAAKFDIPTSGYRVLPE